MRHILSVAVLSFGLATAVPAVQAQTVNPSPAGVRGGTFKLDPSHSKITWSVDHFGFSTYVGQFSHVDGTLKLDPAKLGATALDVTVDAASIGTLNPALDKNLKAKEFLDVARFPTATFHATRVTRTGDRTADIAGALTLRGVTRPVVVHATFNQAGRNPVDPSYRLGFAGAARLKRSEFGITAYLPNLGDEVTLTVEAEFRKAG